MKSYRVWVKDSGFANSVTCLTDWKTRKECHEYIIRRWGHFPPWAYISEAKDRWSFIRFNGE